MQMMVTNLRMLEDEFRRQKMLAVEEGVSFNEYVVRALRERALEKQFGMRPTRKKKIKKGEPDNMYDALLKLATEPYEARPMGLSEEDRAIYGE